MACANDADRENQYAKLAITLKGNVRIWQQKSARHGDGSPFFFLSSMPGIDADGDPWAYAPRNSGLTGHDDLGSAYHKPKLWHQTSGPFPDQPGQQADDWPGIAWGAGGPAIQSRQEPAPGFYVSQSALRDDKFPNTDQRRYCNALRIPYIALSLSKFRSVGYLRMGDFIMCMNITRGVFCFGLIGDGKNTDVLEGSVALAKCLGVNPSPKSGGENHRVILCMAFPGSGFFTVLPKDKWKAGLPTPQTTGARNIPPVSSMRATAEDNYERGHWKQVLADCFGEHATAINHATETFPESDDPGLTIGNSAP
jgi:hypothetical protein